MVDAHFSVVLYENIQKTYDNKSPILKPFTWATGGKGKTSFDKIKFDTNCICSQGGDIETFSEE